MKLATLKSSSSRDGTLIIVSKDLRTYVAADAIAPNLQYALENWDSVWRELDQAYSMLSAGQVSGALPLDMNLLAAPLPRSYQWLDGSIYTSHAERVRRARGESLPETFFTDPQMYQGASDNMLGCREDILVADDSWGVDFEAEVAVITDDVPMGISAQDAASHIKLIMLTNDVSLRYIAATELKKGFGFVQAKPASAFSAVAVTPDELGDAWVDGKINLPLQSFLNGQLFGKPNAAEGMAFNFEQLIAHAARTRFLSAGTIIGSGTVSNADEGVGVGCIIEQRTLEKINTGSSTTSFLKFGDQVTIDMKDELGHSIFGAIDQKVVQYQKK